MQENMKKWILRIAGFLILAIPMAIITISYLKAYSNPYGEISTADIEVPEFKEVAFPFTHEYDKGKSLPFTGSGVIDIDGNGTYEVFVGGGYNQQDAILKFNGQGFDDATARLGKGLEKKPNDTTYGIAVIDANGDGRSDLFIARDSGITLYFNSPEGFKGRNLKIPFNSKSVPLSISLADLNHDGFVDMYVSTYIKLAQVEGENIFNQKNYGSTSLLMLNNGDNTFKDITKEAGIEYVHNTFVAVFSDVDRDGDQDIVVAHDTGQVRTLRNDGNLKFTPTQNPSTKMFSYPMGVAVGDYNNDKLIDFFFSNVSSTPPRFLAKGDLRDDQTFHTPLMFFRNDGQFKFTDAAQQTKTADYEFSWGVVFEDLNNDGREDLLIAQNYVSLPLQKIFRLPGRVLMQLPDGTFANAEKPMGLVNRNYEITPLVADFNNDGYRDIVKINLAGKSRAFISQGGDASYLKVQLPDNAYSLGALVEVERDDGIIITQQITSGEGMSSDQSHKLIFGLGKSLLAKQVTVYFADGTVRQMGPQELNATLLVQQQ